MIDHNTLNQTARKIAKATCQLYLYRPNRIGVPYAHGCCVLFQFNDKFYCFSNAHVLGDQYFGDPFVLTSKNNLNTKGRTTTIGGQYYFTELPESGKRDDDPLDMAIVQLTTDCANDLKARGYLFITYDYINSNYFTENGDRLLVAGYPGSGTKVNTHFRNVIAKPFYLLTSPYLGNISLDGFNTEYNIAAKYSRGKIFNSRNGEVQKGPMPHGISGSGLWHINQGEDGKQEYFLVGILSTYIQKRNIIIGTKIDLFVDLIRQKFDSTIKHQGSGLKILSEKWVTK